MNQTLSLYRAVLAREGIDRRMYVYSVESLAQMAFEYVGTHEGLMVTDRFVRDAYRRSGVRELTDHLARLIDQYRWGFAMVLLQVVTQRARDNDTLEAPTDPGASDAPKRDRFPISPSPP